jgi:hypothetical protein
MTMSKELVLRNALNYLGNNWRLNPTMRETFDAIFKKLDSGSNADKANAEILLKYLAYPGSDDALTAVHSLHASLLTTQGKRAAGLEPRRRGRSYPSKAVKLEDKLMQVMIARELGEATDAQVDIEAIGWMGANAVDATRQSFLEELRPRAARYALFYKRFFDAKSKEEQL